MNYSKRRNLNQKLRGHALLPESLRRKLPPLYTTDGQGDEAIAQAKFFTPASNWYWYPVEFDGIDTFFGLVFGFTVELGYFSLKELEEICQPMGLPIERDLGFEPQSLKKIKAEHERSEGTRM